MSLAELIISSWHDKDGKRNATEELLNWINELNRTTYVDIRKCSINDNDFWFYDDYRGEVLNRKRSFFSIRGMRYYVDGRFVKEQPMIDQPEIGYLGIICKMFDGVLHFLMQAKIEPGNVNCVQISPTVQATKSNFTRVHGGKFPDYFSYFERSNHYNIIYDQIQSEQGARFYKKRNRNMLMLIDEDIEELPNFRWMTLGQIKQLMSIDNLVNMDTRTVLSGLPLAVEKTDAREKSQIERMFTDKALYRSIFERDITGQLPAAFSKLNNYKMFHDTTVSIVPLNQLVDWQINEYGITCKKKADYSVAYYDIEIAGREVRHWMQPLFTASGMATVGLLTKVEDSVRKFLVRLRPEIGSFDKAEFGPSVQWEPSVNREHHDRIDDTFGKHLEQNEGIMRNVVLSEEGGRFFREQNRNVIMEIGTEELNDLPEDALWVDYATLNFLTQSNNYLNIQLRNLLSLLNI